MRQKLQKIFSCILIQVFLLLPAHCFGADNRDTLAPYINITRIALKAAFDGQGIINLDSRLSDGAGRFSQSVFGDSSEEPDTAWPDVDREFNWFLTCCAEATGAVNGSILLWDTTGEPVLRFSHSIGPASQRLKYFSVPADMGISGQVVREGNTFVVNEYQGSHFAFDEVTGIKTENLLAFPIIIEGKVIGVLELINKPGGFYDAEIGIVGDLFRDVSPRIKAALQFQKEKEQFLKACVELAEKIEVKHLYTGGHVLRVKKYALMIANEMKLTRKEKEEVQISAVLHDVGKKDIPDSILDKDGPLTADESEMIQTHTLWGEKYLKVLFAEYPNLRRFLSPKQINYGLMYHHERLDGKGYPYGLHADKIPLSAKIIAVADTFDALTTDRPYHKGIGFEEAMAILNDLKESQVCPEVVDAFGKALLKERDMKAVFQFEDLIEDVLSNDTDRIEVALSRLNGFARIKAKRFTSSYLSEKGQEIPGFRELRFLLGAKNTDFVLNSVIYNALKYGNGDAVVLVRRIEENKVRLIIQDNGMGIDLSGLAPRIDIRNGANGEGLSLVKSSLWKLLDLVVKTYNGRVIIKSQDRLKVFYPSKGENGWLSKMVDVGDVNIGLRIEIEIPLPEEALRNRKVKLRAFKQQLAAQRFVEISI